MLVTLATLLLTALTTLVTASPIKSPHSPAARSPTPPFSPINTTIHPSFDCSKCLAASSIGAYADVVIQDCGDWSSPNIWWTVAPGPTYIRLQGTNWCVSSGINALRGWFPANGKNAVISNCFGGPLPDPNDPGNGIIWTLNQDGTFAYKGSDQCLDNRDGASTTAQTWQCFQGNANQKWITSPQVPFP